MQKESETVEGHLKVDHIHALISVPPKYAVAQVVGFIKGKSTIWVARTFGRKRTFIGQNFWARGYCVLAVGLDDETIREYIRNQVVQDKRFDQMKIFWGPGRLQVAHGLPLLRAVHGFQTSGYTGGGI